MGVPFHRISLLGVSTILFLIGSTGGGVSDSLGTGRSISTEWVATGMDMMNTMRSTSRTSINGVMFISIIGLPSSLPPDIAMANYSLEIFGRPKRQAFGSTGFEMKPTVG